MDYKDPVTVPAADLADNPYWKRDTRRQYPRLALYTQQDVVGLLELGSKAVPRIGDGAAGQKQLVEVKEGGKVLAEILKTKNKNEIAELLGEGGLPPLPGLGRIWVQEKNGGYPDKYVLKSAIPAALFGPLILCPY